MKRILALDGGGIRGVFSLQILARIEAIFREERGRPDLVLRDEFDFFAGTSTGAIIATFLAWGLSVREIDDLYGEQGAKMFAPSAWYNRFQSKYRAETIADFFRERFCEDSPPGTPALLGTRKLFEGDIPKYLLVVMRNATTGSAWPVSNNPKSRYNDPAHPGCNLRIPLWSLLRASTAAPTYFPPESIVLGDPDKPQLFIDGGMTPYNNPALIAMLMATLDAYGLGWKASRHDLHLVSIGTGSERAHLPQKLAKKLHMLDFAQYVAPALIGSAATEQDLLCRVLGDCVFGDDIDRDLRGLHGPNLLSQAEKKFTYARYDRLFTKAETAAIEVRTGQKFSLDNLSLIKELRELGAAYAATNVQREHLFPRV